jgi:hypothetical protein
VGVKDASLIIADVFIAEHVREGSVFKLMILRQAEEFVMWCELNDLTNDTPSSEFLFNLSWACWQGDFNVLWHNNVLVSRLELHPPSVILGVGGLIILYEGGELQLDRGRPAGMSHRTACLALFLSASSALNLK